MYYTQQWRDAGLAALTHDEAQATAAMQWLRDAYAQGDLPVLRLPAKQDDIKDILRIARHIRDSSKGLLVLGTGGSSLGGQALCALSDDPFPIYFIDNLDPHTLTCWTQREDIADWHILAVSKSGSTVETITQCLLLFAAIEAKVGAGGIASRCHAIAMAGDNALRRLSAQYGIPVLEHDAQIGGRYAVLSSVGLLPAAVAGLDIGALRTGAQSVMLSCLDNEHPSPLAGAVWQAQRMQSHPVSVLMPYCDRLALLGAWHMQLWAESLGKQGKGSTPVRAVGATDQHSQLQLYIDGPKDKNFTFITLPHDGEGPCIDTKGLGGFAHLQGLCVGEVMASLQHGTIETLSRHQLPVRLLSITRLDEAALGALLMHFMLETMLTAQLIGVDAFDQPAVEEGKQLARDYLRKGQAA